jgi:hypothetical protein
MKKGKLNIFMRSINEINNSILYWTQNLSSVKPEYELLTSEGNLLGTLQWEKILSSSAFAESADGKWSFTKKGIIKQQIIIRVIETEHDIAKFSINWNGSGKLEFGEEQNKFNWNRTSLLHNEWSFTDTNEKKIVTLKPRLIKSECDVEITKTSQSTSINFLLIALGWYLIVLLSTDSTGRILRPKFR